jgi:WD40 repeat protein
MPDPEARSAIRLPGETRSAFVTLTEHSASVSVADYDPDGIQLAKSCEDVTARVWDPATHKTTTNLTSDVSALAYHTDGVRVATTTGNAVHLWDITTGEPTLTLIRHTNIVVSAAFSPDGARLATASDDHTARIWNSNSGEAMHIFGGLDT